MTQIVGARTYVTQTQEEVEVIGHLRGDLHYGPMCAICRAENRATIAEQMTEGIITGVTPPVQTCEVCDPVADCRRACSARS